MARSRRQSATFSLFAFQDIITSVTGIMILVTLILLLELIHRKETATPDAMTQEVASSVESSITEVDSMVQKNKQLIDKLRDELKRSQAETGQAARFDARGIKSDAVDLEALRNKLAADLRELEQQVASAQSRQSAAEKQKKRHEDDPQKLQQLMETIRKKRQELQELRTEKRVIFNPAPGEAKKAWLVEISKDGFTAAIAGQRSRASQFGSVQEFAAWAKSARDPNREFFVLLVKPSGIENYAYARTLLRDAGYEIGYDLLQEDQTAVDPETGAGTR